MATVPLAPDELIKIIEDVTLGDISIEDANRRIGILETELEKYYCETCRFFRDGECQQPGQPSRPEHPLSARCGSYRYDDSRDHALPSEPKRNGGIMFK
jgi:hypothetical protein